jgi:hypothetical protein
VFGFVCHRGFLVTGHQAIVWVVDVVLYLVGIVLLVSDGSHCYLSIDYRMFHPVA